jgi:hypothetical protein
MSKIFGVHIPADFKNLAINGGMDLFQRFAGAAQTVNTATTSNAYIGPDMFATLSAGSTVKNYSVASSANVPSLAQSGFNSTNSAIYTHVTAIPSCLSNTAWKVSTTKKFTQKLSTLVFG